MAAVSLQLAGLLLSLLAGEVLHQLGLTQHIPESAATLAIGLALGACGAACPVRAQPAVGLCQF
jgi:hypothetical protein